MLLRKFIKNERGSVAISSALIMLPIMLASGMALDYTRTVNYRNDMQSAADATALSLVRYASTMSASDLTAKGSEIFRGVYAKGEVEVTNVATTYTYNQGSSIDIRVEGRVPTSFLSLIHVDTIEVGASSTVRWGQSRLRVALALDNTGSMSSDGKMDALKTATRNLINQLKTAAQKPGDVYVSIIPFNKNVNAMDLGDINSDWIRWTSTPVRNDGWERYNGTNHALWDGCIMDRDQNDDVKNTMPRAVDRPTLFPAQQYSSCPAPMMGLTYDWTKLLSKVDEMTPDGNTNQAIGLAWAWQSLSGTPFVIPPYETDIIYQKVIILLTDGLNTQNRWTTSRTTIDNRQATLCDNVKADNVTLYTIQVNTGGDATSTLLRNCASTTSKFFILTSANQIVTTFREIGSQISTPRLEK